MNNTQAIKILSSREACKEGIDYVATYEDFQDAYNNCMNEDWLFLLAVHFGDYAVGELLSFIDSDFTKYHHESLIKRIYNNIENSRNENLYKLFLEVRPQTDLKKILNYEKIVEGMKNAISTE